LDDYSPVIPAEELPIKILVVDDEDAIRELLAEYFTPPRFVCKQAGNASEAMSALTRDTFHLVLCDILMPELNGLELLSLIKAMDTDIEVIMLTSICDVKVAVSALRSGARDYITKPFNSEELMVTVERALERRRMQIENRNYRVALEKKVRERTRALDETNKRLKQFSMEIINTLVSAIDANDKYTEGHSRRVAEWSKKLALAVGLYKDEAEDIYLAGLLHDIGKIGIPTQVLNKPGRLTDEEFTMVKKHPLIAEKILSNTSSISDIVPFIRSHHESYDGRGYPDGLASWEIKLGARILTVADSFDAMTSSRAYRPAMSFEKGIEELRRCAGKQFDPVLVDSFIEVLESGKHRQRESAEPVSV